MQGRRRAIRAADIRSRPRFLLRTNSSELTSVLHQSQQKEVNLEDIEKMKVEEDDSDSEDEGSLGQPALPQEQTLVSLGALESYLHDVAVPLGFDVARSKWYGRKNEASGKMSRLYFRCCRGSKQDCRRKVDSWRHTIKTECKWKVAAVLT
ncbi:hypothetical protein E4U51_003518 [Claviceps purpurea]|nr:hypothetical protein E4U51_003518 [Claviceps purpurea]